MSVQKNDKVLTSNKIKFNPRSNGTCLCIHTEGRRSNTASWSFKKALVKPEEVYIKIDNTEFTKVHPEITREENVKLYRPMERID